MALFKSKLGKKYRGCCIRWLLWNEYHSQGIEEKTKIVKYQTYFLQPFITPISVQVHFMFHYLMDEQRG
jgi:hypothetical protein